MLLPSTSVHPTGYMLGQGAYSDVLEVEYKGKKYAAKQYRIMLLTKFPDFSGAFSREHEILTRISHPNIVSYFGICKLATYTQDNSTVIVMERMRNNLTNFIKENRCMSLEKKMRILLDIANGLNHLHTRTPAIIHRDLTATNVLLDCNGTAKISDFGNSRIVDIYATPELLTSRPGTSDYMPPEAMEGGDYNEKLDIFSFSHLSIYILLQTRPHKLLRHAYVHEGRRNARTEVERRQHYLDKVKLMLRGGESNPMYNLIIECLQDEAHLRPSSAKVVSIMIATSITATTVQHRPKGNSSLVLKNFETSAYTNNSHPESLEESGSVFSDM